jgi:hypothetical protein
MFKPKPRKNNVIQNPNFVSFLKNDKFSGYKNLFIIFAVIWGLLTFILTGFLQLISVLLFIASLASFLILPKISKKHEKDQFVIEYQFGLHEVTQGIQKKIPWSHVICFVNSYHIANKKSKDYESTFYIITQDSYIKIDHENYSDDQMEKVYNILGPYLNKFNRYVAGENIIRVELRDINHTRQQFVGQYLYLQK